MEREVLGPYRMENQVIRGTSFLPHDAQPHANAAAGSNPSNPSVALLRVRRVTDSPERRKLTRLG